MTKVLSFLGVYANLFLMILSNDIFAGSEAIYPSNLLQLDDKFTHHILVVEKATHKLFLFKNKDGVPQLEKEFQTATGKNPGNKFTEGDKKTPEGIYQLNRFYDAAYLVKTYNEYGKIYGAGAFVLDYPNVLDKRESKSGDGIWLHSTDDESRISKGLDTRGCVVLNDANLKEVAQYIDLDAKTEMIIVENLNYWNESTWKKNKLTALKTVTDWMKSWNDANINSYLSFYSRSEFKDNNGKNYTQWADHKTRVFKTVKATSIKMRFLSLKKFNDYVYASFEQDYTSSAIVDTGRKYLILKPDENYNLKIVYEGWESLKQFREIAFTPSQRFF